MELTIWWPLEVSANLREVTHNPEKAPTRAFSLLKWPINYQHFHNWDSIDVKIEELYSRDTDRIHSIGIISQPKTGHCTGKWWGSKCYKDTNIGHLTLTLIDINIESASHFSGRKGIFQKVQLIHNNVQWPSLVFQYVKNIFCCLKSKKVTFFTILNLLLQPKICSTQEQVVCLLVNNWTMKNYLYAMAQNVLQLFGARGEIFRQTCDCGDDSNQMSPSWWSTMIFLNWVCPTVSSSNLKISYRSRYLLSTG